MDCALLLYKRKIIAVPTCRDRSSAAAAYSFLWPSALQCIVCLPDSVRLSAVYETYSMRLLFQQKISKVSQWFTSDSRNKLYPCYMAPFNIMCAGPQLSYAQFSSTTGLHRHTDSTHCDTR